MPITKSAKKALRQNKKRRAINIAKKGEMKKLLKRMKGLLLAKKTEEAKKLLPQVYKMLDKAAKVGLIKKNAASRKKSRIAHSLSISKK